MTGVREGPDSKRTDREAHCLALAFNLQKRHKALQFSTPVPNFYNSLFNLKWGNVFGTFWATF